MASSSQSGRYPANDERTSTWKSGRPSSGATSTTWVRAGIVCAHRPGQGPRLQIERAAVGRQVPRSVPAHRHRGALGGDIGDGAVLVADRGTQSRLQALQAPPGRPPCEPAGPSTSHSSGSSHRAVSPPPPGVGVGLQRQRCAERRSTASAAVPLGPRGTPTWARTPEREFGRPERAAGGPGWRWRQGSLGRPRDRDRARAGLTPPTAQRRRRDRHSVGAFRLSSRSVPPAAGGACRIRLGPDPRR